ncbi:MAG: hypothetical protein VZR55_01115 [Candidatus Enteromonas sp.]|jgi:hypothetical protein|nr:hypothetical protein [Bacilli bacterium]MBQ4183196.1 hypothetical protein [Bacilli bacterium]MEE3426479.1 hypothetical protein [Candidatus Enteromonas sp.]
MNKGKFLLFAGILGLAFSTAFVSMAAKGESKIHPAEEISFREANHNDDELGLKILHFEEKESEGEKKTGAAPARQWEDKDTGFVIFGITMGVSVCLIGTMVALSIIKKKKGNAQKEEQQ